MCHDLNFLCITLSWFVYLLCPNLDFVQIRIGMAGDPIPIRIFQIGMGSRSIPMLIVSKFGFCFWKKCIRENTPYLDIQIWISFLKSCHHFFNCTYHFLCYFRMSKSGFGHPNLDFSYIVIHPNLDLDDLLKFTDLCYGTCYSNLIKTIHDINFG